MHTLGILLETQGYKDNVRSGNVFGLAKAILGLGGDGAGDAGNPLRKGAGGGRTSYEGMNRDSALMVLDTMLNTSPEATPPPSPASASSPKTNRSFVYVSAADCFRPLIPSRYIETKRQAEMGIARKIADQPDCGITPTFIRPGEPPFFSYLSYTNVTAGLGDEANP